MSYLVRSFPTLGAANKAAFGVELTLSPEQEAQLDRVELWGSSFDDPGGDWTQYKAVLKNGRVLEFPPQSGY